MSQRLGGRRRAQTLIRMGGCFGVARPRLVETGERLKVELAGLRVQPNFNYTIDHSSYPHTSRRGMKFVSAGSLSPTRFTFLEPR